MLSVRLLAHLHIHDNVSNWKWVLYLTWNFFRVYIFTQFLSNSTEHISINTGSYFPSVAFREWIPVQMKYVLPPSAEPDFYKGEHILLLFLTLVKDAFFFFSCWSFLLHAERIYRFCNINVSWFYPYPVILLLRSLMKTF